VIVCILKSGGLNSTPHSWHSRAGGGAVHSINSGHSANHSITSSARSRNDKAFENIDCMSAILRCQAKNRFYESTQRSRAVAKHIGLSATRRETLSWLALLIMQHGTISLWRLAAYVASAAQTASVQRRFYRFFQFVRLDGTHSARVVVELLGLSGKPWVLAIDRTNWDFGKTTINILMICVLQKHMRGGVMN
jgi:hypothetical protein